MLSASKIRPHDISFVEIRTVMRRSGQIRSLRQSCPAAITVIHKPAMSCSFQSSLRPAVVLKLAFHLKLDVQSTMSTIYRFVRSQHDTSSEPTLYRSMSLLLPLKMKIGMLTARSTVKTWLANVKFCNAPMAWSVLFVKVHASFLSAVVISSVFLVRDLVLCLPESGGRMNLRGMNLNFFCALQRLQCTFHLEACVTGNSRLECTCKWNSC